MYSLLAQIDISDPNTFAPARVSSIGTVLNFVIPVIIFGGAMAFLVMLLFGAFQWLTAGDSAENVGKAQKTIQFSILGFVLLVLSFFIMRVISMIFGIANPLPF